MKRLWTYGVALALSLSGCGASLPQTPPDDSSANPNVQKVKPKDIPKDPPPVNPTELVDPEIGVERTAQLLELCQAQADTAPPLTKTIAEELSATQPLYLCSLQSPNPEAGPPGVDRLDEDARIWQALITDQPLPEGCWDAKTEPYWWPTYLTDGTTVWKTRDILCDFMQETP